MPFRHDHSCLILIQVSWVVISVAVTGAITRDVPKQVNTEKNEPQLRKEAGQLLAEAEALYREKRYEEAILLQQRSLALREKSLGPEHSDVGDVLFAMGVTFQQMGAFHKALPVFERCLAIKEKTVGMENDQVATILAGVGLMQKEQGNFAQAVAAFTRSLAIVEKI